MPAIKPLVVKIFPTMLLSDLYARTKGAAYYARSAGRDGVVPTPRGGEIAMRSAGQGPSPMRPHIIQVEQSFEMRSVPATSAGVAGASVTATATVTARADDADGEENPALSRDGSEKNLVASSWQDEYRLGGGQPGQKKVTITSHPHEMV